MTTLTYAVLDSNRMVTPDGTIYSSALGATPTSVVTPNDLSIIHADRAVAAGTSFSIEFLVAAANLATGEQLVFGLGDNNSSYPKALEVRGASQLVKANSVNQAGTGLAMPASASVRVDFYAPTGRCVVWVNNALKADIVIANLVGKSIWVFGRSTTLVGTLEFRFGATPFSTPVPYGLQGGVFSTSSATVVADAPSTTLGYDVVAPGTSSRAPVSVYVESTGAVEPLLYESAYGVSYNKPLFDLGRGSQVSSGSAVVEQRTTTVDDTNFVFVPLLQGSAYSGGIGIGVDIRHGALVPTKSPMRIASLLRGSNTKSGTSAFEQMREEEVKPKVYWGDS